MTVQSEPRVAKSPVRFGLRWLLVLVALVALGLGLLVVPAHLQRSRVAWILEHGGTVHYDDQILPSGPSLTRPRRPPAPAPVSYPWLRRHVGEDYFHKVVWVKLPGGEVNDLTIEGLTALGSIEHLEVAGGWATPAGLQRLASLTRLRQLNLNGWSLIDDDSLAPLRQLESLEQLSLSHTHIGDSGLAHLAGLTELKTLELESTNVSDAGLKHLYGLRKLRLIDLRSTAVTSEGVAALRAALPQARVFCTEVNPIWTRMK